MMLRSSGKQKQGFTLIELAIVLTIAGLMFAGLWRLLNGGNQQVRDQSAASLQTQLINSTKNFLASTQGQNWMAAIAPNTAANLLLPTVANSCNPAGTQAAQFACFLPAGFLGVGAATPTYNSYGQGFTIQVLKDSAPNLPTATPPATYSFMIVTTGGDTIPDTSGGRISASIGNDGGFLFTGPGCTAAASPTTACGSYGTWSISNITSAGTATPPGYSVPAGFAVGGHIASRTYSTPSANNFPWLDRLPMPGDNPAQPIWNSMQTDLFLGAVGGTGAPNSFWLGLTSGSTTGGGTIDMQGGHLTTGKGTSPNTILGDGTASGLNAFTITPSDFSVDASSPGMRIFAVPNGGGSCLLSTQGSGGAMDLTTCKFALDVQGDANFGHYVQANEFFSPNVVYQQSDIRFKTNIKTLNNALDDVMKLNPVSFTFKENGKDSLGVIAQEVEKIYPQLVGKSPMDGSKTVYYIGFIAPLISSVQELKKENDMLHDQLQQQENEIRLLEKKLGGQRPTP